MFGWNGSLLRVDLTTKTYHKEPFTEDFAHRWVGGRGFAVKILWDELKPNIDPLGPENKFIVSLGPISGIPAPNTGKAVVAAKSPMTGGYGDGNLGTMVAEQLRKAGYDLLIVEGKSSSPVYLYIKDNNVEFLPAEEIWGKGSFDTNAWLYEKYGKRVGVLNIGQAGENMVLYAVVRSMEGRAGGRTGMGAVMGSKLLKAVVVEGTGKIPVAEPELMKKIGVEDLKKVHDIDKKTRWSVQGTDAVFSWLNDVAALPVRNFRETHHRDAWKLDGERLNEARVATYGCPNCTMHCGIAIRDDEGRETEMDYENIALLGSNLGIFELKQVGSLNYLCDDYGMDTMSAGGTLAFYADAVAHGIIEGDFRFGDAQAAKRLLGMTARREGELGNMLADGSLRMAKKFGHDSEAYAMQVKGLELAAYNCKFIPGMALAFGTSPIGAHHKEAWIISYELNHTVRGSYGRDKAEKVVELQRIRGGMFESLVSCRFPWIELGWDLENYPKYFNAATGLKWTLEDFWNLGDRIYALMKFFWVREIPQWDRTRDYPPMAWFDKANADKKGPIAGKILERKQYDELLSHYYDIRGWDERGIPTRKTAERLHLDDEMKEVEKFTTLES